MAIADGIREALTTQSMVRKMFEEGIRLKKEHGAENVFDFSLGNPDLDPPAAFNDAVIKLLSQRQKGSHGYMPNGGFPAVRAAIAARAGREQGVALDGTCIVMSAGAAGGLNVLFKAILNPHDEVIVSRPYFMEYRPYVQNHGGTLVEVDSLPDFNLDIEAIASRFSLKTAAVLINSPHNPSGRIYPGESIRGLAAALTAHGKRSGRFPYLVSDEPYRTLAYEGRQVPPVLSAYRQAVVVSSYSKSLSLAGERIGYIAVNPEAEDRQRLIDACAYATRVLGFVNAGALMQRVVAELAEEQTDVAVYERRRDLFTGILDEAGIAYTPSEGAFYLFCKAPGGNDLAFVDHLKKHLILGVPGTGFAKAGWFRLAYCVDEAIINASRPAFLAAMKTYQE